MSNIIGIDFGTSTSEVAVLKEGKTILIPNKNGKTITPSVVYINDNDEVKIGEDAVSYAVLEPENTAIEIKRLIGSGKSVQLGRKNLKPEEIAAYIIKYLKQCAEKYLGETIEEAVITVPAYFTNKQRVETKQAGEIAGLKVERIINEPTSAALAYGIENIKDEKHLLVYDLGGGTFDVTVLELFEGVLDVKASNGNTKLGGKDFDEALINKLANEFEKEHKINIRKDLKAMARLKETAEKTKIKLSSEKKAEINIPFLAMRDNNPVGISTTITRKKFESIIKDMVNSTLAQVDLALADSNLKTEDIDKILLVGGSTKIPFIREVLRDKFGKEPVHEINPDEAVAMGAAVQAGIKAGELTGENDIVITDVCPYTLGIECVKRINEIPLPGIFDEIIPRNKTIPVSVVKNYKTFTDNQKEVHVRVYQGDNIIAEKNNFLGEFILGSIPPKKAGEEALDIEFLYDINGILNVKAMVRSTGKDAQITIDTREVKMDKEPDVEKEWKKSKRAKKLRPIIRKAEKMLSDSKIGDELKEEIDILLYELKYALAKDDNTFISRYEEELTDILYGALE